MNVIAQLEFELTYYESAAQRLNHYATRTHLVYIWKSSCGVVTNVQDRDKFEHQSRNYVHFRTNIPGKDMNRLTPTQL